MLKKSIKYTNFDDREVTEDHYFHLSKADLIEMEMSQQGGMQSYITRITDSQDGKKIIEVFKDLIRMSYGIRTEDGRFLRDKQKTEEFMASEAYSELFMELVTDGTAASHFVNGIIPRGLDETAAKLQQSAAAASAEQANGAHEAKEDPTGLTEPTPGAISPEESERVATLTRENLPAHSDVPRLLSTQDVVDMDADELKSGMATGRYKLA